MANTVSSAQEKERISWRAFLENTPPEKQEEIADIAEYETNGFWYVAQPDLTLHCDSDSCNGARFFRVTSNREIFRDQTWKYTYLDYVCRNCRQSKKIYALAVRHTPDLPDGVAYKFGEVPIFGLQTPARVISLIGPDRELFLQGRRSENRGLGIGAFAYYRQVVEHQKGRIIDEIAAVAKRLGASPNVLGEFKAAAKETQFKKAIDAIKTAIPPVLLIEGQNPLTLLHTALSQGLHEEDDARCMELAHSIRLVLVELAERMSQALKDHAELKGAVSKLMGVRDSTEGEGKRGTEGRDAAGSISEILDQTDVKE